MTVTDPIPTTDYGKGAWQDYVSNWRQKDAGWVQERSVLRYATAATRTTDWPSPKPGQVTYRGDVDKLEMWSGLRSAWVNVLLLQYLASGPDTAAGVTLGHTAAAGKGLTLGPSSASINQPVDFNNGLLTAGATGVGIQTLAQKKALLTTNATELVSDTPLAVPGLRLSAGTLDATGRAVTTGGLTATSLTVPSIAMSGTLTGGVLNGTSGTIGGVGLSGNKATASAGFQSGGALFSGNASAAVMRVGTTGSYIQVLNNNISLVNGPAGSLVDIYANTRFLNNTYPAYYYAGNSGVVNIAPSFYSGGDPGAANFPDGTIWCT